MVRRETFRIFAASSRVKKLNSSKISTMTLDAMAEKSFFEDTMRHFHPAMFCRDGERDKLNC